MRCARPSVDELKRMGYTHILLAVGAWKPGKLDIAGDVAGAIQWMKGVKVGNIAVAGNIAVIGGGNTAMDAARLAKRSGAEHVTLVYRRTRKYMPADEHELALALQDGVEFAELAAPRQTGRRRADLREDGAGRGRRLRPPQPRGQRRILHRSLRPGDLRRGRAGGRRADGRQRHRAGQKGRPAFQTNVEGVYAAGDAKRGPATVVEGIADAAAFAEAVIGKAYTYDIPEQAYVTKDGGRGQEGYAEDERVHLLRGRALPAVRHRV